MPSLIGCLGVETAVVDVVEQDVYLNTIKLVQAFP